jgi:hypothetical protein
MQTKQNMQIRYVGPTTGFSYSNPLTNGKLYPVNEDGFIQNDAGLPVFLEDLPRNNWAGPTDTLYVRRLRNGSMRVTKGQIYKMLPGNTQILDNHNHPMTPMLGTTKYWEYCPAPDTPEEPQAVPVNSYPIKYVGPSSRLFTPNHFYDVIDGQITANNGDIFGVTHLNATFWVKERGIFGGTFGNPIVAALTVGKTYDVSISGKVKDDEGRWEYPPTHPHGWIRLPLNPPLSVPEPKTPEPVALNLNTDWSQPIATVAGMSIDTESLRPFMLMQPGQISVADAGATVNLEIHKPGRIEALNTGNNKTMLNIKTTVLINGTPYNNFSSNQLLNMIEEETVRRARLTNLPDSVRQHSPAIQTLIDRHTANITKLSTVLNVAIKHENGTEDALPWDFPDNNAKAAVMVPNQ